MNYQRVHDSLIARARSRILECYCERHHVIPRCLGGSNESSNIVSILPEEHYVVHQLLVKINPDSPKLVFAAWMMSTDSKNTQRLNNKRYGWVRRKVAIAMADIHRGTKQSTETKELRASKMRGRHQTKGTKLKISAANKVLKNNSGLCTNATQ